MKQACMNVSNKKSQNISFFLHSYTFIYTGYNKSKVINVLKANKQKEANNVQAVQKNQK